ncbi:hypothetical protein J2R76_003645 [Bradyrhizobium sp. USDA 4532]|uniref:hypothetical protein n=1 Tax=unclassified Bradyrhizobium TaxID=2631580 RepID=UPI00209F383A|nr:MULTISPECIES: hypothetical protein [unclassified Bradyrhizobium]MCP1835308.1 hypothetical protein [Bradyrhizobium sp. USDA 4545]MCP1920054.1 hypothetical protein [Bradyrhizobium sp. USDA 4532]
MRQTIDWIRDQPRLECLRSQIARRRPSWSSQVNGQNSLRAALVEAGEQLAP